MNENGAFEQINKVYLDYNATTPLEPDVAESIANALLDCWSNPSSQYEKSKYAKSHILESRKNIAKLINAPSASDIIFVSGGTEANNMVFYSVLNHFNSNLKSSQMKLPHFIISTIEHDSVKLIADHFKQHGLAEVTEISVDLSGCVNVSNVIKSIQSNTVLISIMLANNETGVIQPVSAITKTLKELGFNNECEINSQRIYIHTDAAQAIGKIDVDVADLDVDYLTIVGHKFYGPRIGALYVRNCLAQRENKNSSYQAPIFPILFGGGQENGNRPGTENTPMIVGLGKAAELVTKNLNEYQKTMLNIRDYLEERLESTFGCENLHFNGRCVKSQRLPNTCNVSFINNEKFKGYEILKRTIYLEASTGASCHSGEMQPSKILKAMGLTDLQASNAIRLSVGRCTTKEEIDLIIEDISIALEEIKSK